MTYEELLADIASKNYRESRTLETPYAALRAVVELHQPVKIPSWVPTEFEFACELCPGFYPCPTVEAIEKELA
jgi:hypothetical protein